MKGTFFNKPLEWNIETREESWTQGGTVNGVLKLKNHGTDKMDLPATGVALAHADIKKVHARTEGALKISVKQELPQKTIEAGESLEFPFTLKFPENCAVSDKRSTFFITYGRNYIENNLQLKVEPKLLYGKLVGLLDTFYRFKLKEVKAIKSGVEYKLIPPTSRDMANLESLGLAFSMEQDKLEMVFDFQVKKLDTSGITTKVEKAAVKIEKVLAPKDYSLGRDMINQDQLLKVFGEVIAEVKLKSVF